MSNRRSSFRAETRERTARRGAWPWLLGAGPAAVVAASVATAWVAMNKHDTVVAENYYKLGLMVNRTLASQAPAPHEPGALIRIESSGAVQVRLIDALSPPMHLRLAVRRPGERGETGTIALQPSAADNWTGTLGDVAGGLRIVSLESDTWRWPVTVVLRLPAEIRFGVQDTHS